MWNKSCDFHSNYPIFLSKNLSLFQPETSPATSRKHMAAISQLLLVQTVYQ